MDSFDHTVRLEVNPEATDEELAAIVSAVMALRSSGQRPADQRPERPSRWASAGREENHSPFHRSSPSANDLP